MGADVPKVVDTTGEALALRFEEFLEEYIKQIATISATH